MKSPEFDSDGYPTANTERAIETWPYQDMGDLFRFIQDAWKYPDSFKISDDGKVTMATGGWSGNEQLVNALMRNTMVRAISWQLSQRGGYYEFEIPDWAMGKESVEQRSDG